MRVVIAGASTLLGKELNEELSDSALANAEIVLLDADAAAGQVTTSGDEATFIQRLDRAAFSGADFAFFTGTQAQTREFWLPAREAGAVVIDLTYALVDEPEVLVWSPWLQAGQGRGQTASGAGQYRAARPDLQTAAVVPAHPVATMLSLLAVRLTHAFGGPQVFAATVLQPASEYGSAGMEELHQQTVSLLSFKELPQDLFDAQVAFNLLPSFGENAKRQLNEAAHAIRQQYALLSNGQLPELNLQLLQSPVFHGYTASLFVTLPELIPVKGLQDALDGGAIEVMPEDVPPPTNLSAASRREVLVQVMPESQQSEGSRFWLWLAADNLKLASANAIGCALAMKALRPQGKVQ